MLGSIQRYYLVIINFDVQNKSMTIYLLGGTIAHAVTRTHAVQLNRGSIAEFLAPVLNQAEIRWGPKFTLSTQKIPGMKIKESLKVY